MAVEVHTATTEEPVSLTEAKAHLRVVDSTDDTYITTLITAARQRAEVYLNRSISSQTLAYTLDSFPAEFVLPRTPVRSVTAITYTDEEGNSQTLAPSVYQSTLKGETDHRIKKAVDQSWPSTLSGSYDAVTVRYVAGWSNPSDSPYSNPLPTPIKQAILISIAEMYENREETVIGAAISKLPNTVENLLRPYRISLV